MFFISKIVEIIIENFELISIFRFPNDMCEVSGGTKNGTCYTAEECSDKGGKSDGSCADGYGVCCVCNNFKEYSIKFSHFVSDNCEVHFWKRR